MKADDLRSLERTERMMVRWMCGVSLKDRKHSEDLLLYIRFFVLFDNSTKDGDSPVAGRRSPVAGRPSPVAGPRSPVTSHDVWLLVTDGCSGLLHYLSSCCWPEPSRALRCRPITGDFLPIKGGRNCCSRLVQF